jgi:hypothetical protein
MQRMHPEVAHSRDHTGILTVSRENGQTRATERGTAK